MHNSVNFSNASPVPKRPALRLRPTADGRLWASKDSGSEVSVCLRRCFPWSQPLSWLSLRDDSGEEFALLESIEELESESKLALLKVLEEASFVFEVESLIAVDEEYELRQWRVRTKQGERVFQTRVNSWPRELAGGGLLLQDVANDLYVISDFSSLDPSSKKKLWAFLDHDIQRQAKQVREPSVESWRLKIVW